MNRKNFIKTSGFFIGGTLVYPNHIFAQNPMVSWLGRILGTILVDVIAEPIVDYLKREISSEFGSNVENDNQMAINNGMQLQNVSYKYGSLYFFQKDPPSNNATYQTFLVPFYFFNSDSNYGKLIEIEHTRTEHIAKMAENILNVQKSPQKNNPSIILPAEIIKGKDDDTDQYDIRYYNLNGGTVNIQKLRTQNYGICKIQDPKFNPDYSIRVLFDT